MDTIIQTLLSWQFLLFCLAIAALTFIARKIIEYVLDNPRVPASKTSKIWRDLFLPIFPIVIGCLMGLLFKNYSYPVGISTIADRFFFGLVAGSLSTVAYRVINSFLSNKITEMTSAATEATGMGAGSVPQTTETADALADLDKKETEIIK